MFVNQWGASGERQDEEYGQFWKLSGCLEHFVLCLRDTEDSQTGEKLDHTIPMD